MSSAAKFTRCSFCRYIVFYAWRKKLQHAKPNRKLLAVPSGNSLTVRHISNSCPLLSIKQPDNHDSGSSSDSSDSSSSDSDDEPKVHHPKPKTHASPTSKQTASEKLVESESSKKRKTLFTVDGSAEGEPLSRSQLDEAIVEAARSVAEDLGGDTTQTQAELLSQLKQQTRVTIEQKMGKPPLPKMSPLDTLQAMAQSTETDETRLVKEEAEKSIVKDERKVQIPTAKPDVTKSDIETNILGDILKGMPLEGPKLQTGRERREPAGQVGTSKEGPPPVKEASTPTEIENADYEAPRMRPELLKERQEPRGEGEEPWIERTQEPWRDRQKPLRDRQRDRRETQKDRQESFKEAKEAWFISSGKYSNKALNIFSPEDMENAPDPTEENRLFNLLHIELEQERFELPVTNAFEEQIRWTEEGKLWKFPIDNEQGWEEESSISFEEHVFLEDHLDDFPKKGPARHFMELVTTALSKNPYLTVAQKHEHINWYRNYFEEKKSVIEESLVSEVESVKQLN